MSLRQQYWHKLFEAGVAVKGVNGIWETVTGFLVLFVSKATLAGWFSWAASDELLEDPHDKLIGFFSHALQNLSGDAKTFAAIYILLHGLLNIFLAVQLYRDRHWAYLVTIGTMLVFIPYQIYRVSVHHSVLLAVFTLFDALFVALAWHEYRFHRDRRDMVY